jgi:tetratricopeptide (TPR) repeat protein
LNAWVRIAVSFRDERLALTLDGQPVLELSDLAPLPVRRRNRFVLLAHRATHRLRGFLGFSFPLPVRPTSIAIADERAAEGEYEQALQTYERASERTEGTEQGTDLLFKMGMCYLRLGLKIRARSHLDLFAARRAGSIWASIAAAESLRSRLQATADRNLVEEIRSRLAEAGDPANRGVWLDFATEAVVDTAARADRDQVVRLHQMQYEAEPPYYHGIEAARNVVHSLFLAGRYREGIEWSDRVLKEGKLPERRRTEIRVERVLMLAAGGNVRRAAGELERVELPPTGPMRARGDFVRALLAQAAGDLGAAIEGFLAVREGHAGTAVVKTAVECAAQLLATAGRQSEANRLAPGSVSLSEAGAVAHATGVRLSLLAIAGRYEEMLKLAESQAEAHALPEGERIRAATLAALLHELSGDPARAKRNFEVIETSHANGPFWRWALPASYLLRKTPAEDVLRNNRCFALFDDIYSASLLYMLAQVERSRGKSDRADALLRLTIRADPLGYWPAILARRELGKLTPQMKRFLE